jgi:hypothetical protein
MHTLEYLPGPSTTDRCGLTSRQRRPVRLGHQTRHRRAVGDPALGRQDPALDRSSAAQLEGDGALLTPTPAPTSRSPPTEPAPRRRRASPLCPSGLATGRCVRRRFSGRHLQLSGSGCPGGCRARSHLPLAPPTRAPNACRAAVGPRRLVSRETRRHRRPIADGTRVGFVGPVHRKRASERSDEACA